MAQVKFLTNVYSGGELRFPAGDTRELEPDLAARYSRRGWCTPVTVEESANEASTGAEADAKAAKKQK